MVGDPLLDEGGDLLAAARRPGARRSAASSAAAATSAPGSSSVRRQWWPAASVGDRRVGRVLARGDEVQRRAQQRAGDELAVARAPRRGPPARSPRPATTAPPAAPASTAPAARRRPRRPRPAAASRRSSRPWRASSARLSAVVVMALCRVAHARHLMHEVGLPAPPAHRRAALARRRSVGILIAPLQTRHRRALLHTRQRHQPAAASLPRQRHSSPLLPEPGIAERRRPPSRKAGGAPRGPSLERRAARPHAARGPTSAATTGSRTAKYAFGAPVQRSIPLAKTSRPPGALGFGPICGCQTFVAAGVGPVQEHGRRAQVEVVGAHADSAARRPSSACTGRRCTAAGRGGRR